MYPAGGHHIQCLLIYQPGIIDLFLDLFKHIKERFVLILRQRVEVFDHLKDVDGDGRAS